MGILKAYGTKCWVKIVREDFLKEINHETRSKEAPQDKNGFSEALQITRYIPYLLGTSLYCLDSGS